MLAAEMKRADDENRWKQIAAGAGILLALGAAACGTLLGWRHLPGLLGEWVGLIVGVLTTPFFLEASAVMVGLTVVLAINGWRRQQAGEEWVYLKPADEDQAAGKQALGAQPEQESHAAGSPEDRNKTSVS